MEEKLVQLLQLIDQNLQEYLVRPLEIIGEQGETYARPKLNEFGEPLLNEFGEPLEFVEEKTKPDYGGGYTYNFFMKFAKDGELEDYWETFYCSYAPAFSFPFHFIIQRANFESQVLDFYCRFDVCSDSTPFLTLQTQEVYYKNLSNPGEFEETKQILIDFLKDASEKGLEFFKRKLLPDAPYM